MIERSSLEAVEDTPPVLICLLGNFRVFKMGHLLSLRSDGKVVTLLGHLALQRAFSASRDALIAALWPDSDPGLAAQSLNSLSYTLHKLFGDALGGAAPLVHTDGCYRLNTEAGMDFDVGRFEVLADAGDRYIASGDAAAATVAYRRAVGIYTGDLQAGASLEAVIERERLRARYLTLLAKLANDAYGLGDHSACLEHALRLLRIDPCREDALRLVMRCYVRMGQRAQALRQYCISRAILRTEFDARPEQATTALFDLVRLDPESV